MVNGAEIKNGGQPLPVSTTKPHENQAPLRKPAAPELQFRKAVKHDAFGLNLDTGNFHTADPYGDFERIAPYGVVVQIKTEVAPNGKTQDADLARLVNILRKANYRGYVALEYEAKEDARSAIPRHLATLKKLMA